MYLRGLLQQLLPAHHVDEGAPVAISLG